MLAGPPEVAAVGGSKALLMPSGRKLLMVVPVGNRRLLSTSSLCAARKDEASWSDTLTTYDGLAGSPGDGPEDPGALMGTARMAASKATMNLLRRVRWRVSLAKFDCAGIHRLVEVLVLGDVGRSHLMLYLNA